ncbi:MAG: hypothetical protein HYX97_02155 [Chloroflexi bacterium]|nr:hypothetical protein [Chloroflexota bacterium]
MARYRYSRWDGSQEVFPLHEDDLMEELSEHLMSHGDVSSALRAMAQRGVHSRYGERLQGLQDFLQQVRSQRQQILNKYDLDSVLKDITDKLDSIVQKEREGISRRLEEARQRHRQSLAQGGKGALPLKMQEDLLQKLEQRAY